MEPVFTSSILSLIKMSFLFLPFFPRPNSILPRLSTNRDILDATTTQQGVHTRIPTSRHGWPPPWSNCFAGINVHLASATRLLATAERNCRSSTTIIAASHCPESLRSARSIDDGPKERNYVQRSAAKGMKRSVVVSLFLFESRIVVDDFANELLTTFWIGGTLEDVEEGFCRRVKVLHVNRMEIWGGVDRMGRWIC